MKTRATKIIALFDILGTKKRIEQIGIDGVLADYVRLAEFVDKQTGSFVIRPVPAGDGGFCPAAGYLEVQQAYFSDTFLIWADYDSFRMPAFFDMCCDLFCHSVTLGIPLRGGLAVGDAYMDKEKTIFLGPALIDAFEAEEAQQWLGVSGGLSFNKEEFRGPFDPRTILAYSKHQHPKKNYKIPGIVLDWPRNWRSKIKTDPRISIKSMNKDPNFSKYYENAVDFIDFSEQNHDWFLRQDSIKA